MRKNLNTGGVTTKDSVKHWFKNRFEHLLAVATLAGLGLLLPFVAQAQPPPRAQPALVAAAANLQPVLAELGPLFEESQKTQAGPSPYRLTVSIGSSANLVRQIQQGLPAELFLSADEDFALQLFDAGLAPDRGVVYATGRVVLLVPKTSTLALDPQLKGLQAGFAQVHQFAIAKPAFAPYGRAAQQVLQNLALWPVLQGRLVMGENIAQTTQYVSTGAAQAGITALSMVLAPGLSARVRYVVISDALHAPLRQRMVLLNHAGPAARAFYAFMQTPAAMAVLRRYGYQ